MNIRVFTEFKLVEGAEIQLSADENKYLKILRRSENDCLEIFSLPHYLYSSAVISSVKNKIYNVVCGKPEKLLFNRTYLKIIHGITEFEKPDFVIQKCVELGVDEIILIATDKSKNINESKINKYNKIVVEALRQSKSYTPTKIKFAVLNSDFLNSLIEKKLCGSQGDEKEISKIENQIDGAKKNFKYLNIVFMKNENKLEFDFFHNIPDYENVNIFIGPESGFSENEYELLKNYNCEFISINANTLRSETAAVSAAAILKFFLWINQK